MITTGAVVELIAVQYVDLPGMDEVVSMVAYQFVNQGQRSNDITFMRHVDFTTRWVRSG